MASAETIGNLILDDMVVGVRNGLVITVLGSACAAFEPKKIIKSGDVTIVFWSDNSKTIVRRDPEDADNLHTAFCAALAKKVFGSNSHIKKTIAKKLVENKKEKKA